MRFMPWLTMRPVTVQGGSGTDTDADGDVRAQLPWPRQPRGRRQLRLSQRHRQLRTIIPSLPCRFTNRIAEGTDVTFTVSSSADSFRNQSRFGYRDARNGREGNDYTLTGEPGQITIPAGQSSATVVFHAIADQLKERNETAIMVLMKGPGYKVPAPRQGNGKDFARAISASDASHNYAGDGN